MRLLAFTRSLAENRSGRAIARLRS